MSTSSEPTKESDDEVDEEKLKGDAIGGTLYSEKWVIQTLMKLTQVSDLRPISVLVEFLSMSYEMNLLTSLLKVNKTLLAH